MALDSVSDRYSMLNMGMPLLIILPEPDGSITEVDRVHLLRLYGGIDLDEPTAGITTYNLDSDAFSRTLTSNFFLPSRSGTSLSRIFPRLPSIIPLAIAPNIIATRSLRAGPAADPIAQCKRPVPRQ